MERAKRNQRDESPVFTLTQKRESIFRVASRAEFVQLVGSDLICTLRPFVLCRYLALPFSIAAFSHRSSNRGAFIRSTQAANAGVAPRQRSVSTFRKSGASVRRVARFLKSSARSRCSPRTFDGNFSIGPYRFKS